MTDLAEGRLVRHWELGVGRVEQTTDDGITVAFRADGLRTVQDEDLVPLAEDGFWYLVYNDREAAIRMLDEQPTEAIALLLRDFPSRETRTQDIREQLEEFVKEEWRSWWRRTQKLLKQEPSIDTSRSRDEIYALAKRPRSYIEELYDQFQGMRSFISTSDDEGASLVINSQKVAIARRMLAAIAKRERIETAAQEGLGQFVEEAISSDTLPTSDRVDLLLRMVTLRWLPDETSVAHLRELCRVPTRLYELDTFAANRVVDAILKHVGAEDGQPSLLTAFAADPALMHQVTDIYLVRGQPDAVVEGLWIGLSENLLDFEMIKGNKDRIKIARSWYDALAKRLQGLGNVLHTLVFDRNTSIDWAQLAEYIARLLNHLSQLDSQATEISEEALQSLVGFWRRAMVFAPPSEQGRYLGIPLAPGLRTHVVRPFLATIFGGDSHLELADEFVDRMRQGQALPLEPYLECIVEEHWGWASETEALSYLITHLNAREDGLSWITQHTIATVQSKRELLPQYLPVLDQLALWNQAEAQLEKINGLRQQAFLRICEAANTGQELELSAFTFDAVSLAGLREFLDSLERQMRTAREEAQIQIAHAQEETRQAQERLARSEETQEELRRGYDQPRRGLRFAERRRILESLAATTAEFERFATHHETKELTGIVRRLNSLLGSLGVEPFGAIGDEIGFDPSLHEFIGTSDAPVKTVRIVERGYMIRDLDGKQQLLKPAKVTLPGGAS